VLRKAQALLVINKPLFPFDHTCAPWK